MWLIPTKKELKKELSKIQTGFKDRDDKYTQIKKDFEECLNSIKELKAQNEQLALKIATLEGSYLVLSQSQKSQSQVSFKKSQEVSPTFETKLINKIRQNKKSMVMSEIIKLIPTMSVSEMYYIIVKNKRLCSKATFYRHVDSLKSQSLLNNETKLRLN